jgi:2-polyprenyl-3-methyl-5-hydroxy-6-metoxy-1,4-benzoquinol methylase
VNEFLEADRALWDEWTGIHESSEFYRVEAFRAGGIRLRDYELEQVGDVQGKSLLHLQCHFGIDTLSWARLGATVTGADLSPNAIDLARRLAADLGLDARFVESNVYDLPERLEGSLT